MTPPEFSRPVRLDTLGEGERGVALTAEPVERAALATRFGLVAVDRLEASVRIRRVGEIVHAAGSLAAQVVQRCVATDAPLAATIAAPFSLRFVPADGVAVDDEVELSAADCDVIDYSGSAIDLGEAVAETLALALDPFPRSADADAALKAAGVLSEGEAGPFAALKGLLGKG